MFVSRPVTRGLRWFGHRMNTDGAKFAEKNSSPIAAGQYSFPRTRRVPAISVFAARGVSHAGALSADAVAWKTCGLPARRIAIGRFEWRHGPGSY